MSTKTPETCTCVETQNINCPDHGLFQPRSFQTPPVKRIIRCPQLSRKKPYRPTSRGHSDETSDETSEETYSETDDEIVEIVEEDTPSRKRKRPVSPYFDSCEPRRKTKKLQKLQKRCEKLKEDNGNLQAKVRALETMIKEYEIKEETRTRKEQQRAARLVALFKKPPSSTGPDLIDCKISSSVCCFCQENFSLCLEKGDTDKMTRYRCCGNHVCSQCFSRTKPVSFYSIVSLSRPRYKCPYCTRVTEVDSDIPFGHRYINTLFDQKIFDNKVRILQ
jgi:hypothetical protein